ncbi:MAG: glycoside hydrolase family 38 C-terminal domain-containing protein [Armatimonadota bacterium]
MNPHTRARILRALQGKPGKTTSSWLRRADAQISFARSFAALRPASAEDWIARAEDAQKILDTFDTSRGTEGLIEAVRAAETVLAPIGLAAKEYAIHCVGHGHIDMNWMWSWPETVSTTHDTFASVLSLMRQYPSLTYSQSQASVYALMERYHPALFAEIQQRVKEGRWEITAAHWVEGDKNLASGESLARHLLYTRRYFAEKFGLSAEDLPVDWEPDTFGHANTIPDILAKGGVRFYYSCRTGGGFDHTVVGPNPRPKIFWWEGPGGGRVLVNRETTWYNSYVNIGDNIALPAIAFWQDTGLTEWLNIYGIGNHGGGPTRTEIDYLTEMNDWPIYPRVLFSTTKRWFESVATKLPPDLPVLSQELNFEFTGCYTSQSLIKQANRFGENYLVEAETLAALAKRVAGVDYPADLLGEAWRNVLFNQFHDILPGSGVRETREHAMALFQEVGAITGAIKRSSGQALTAQIDTLSLLPETPDADDERELLRKGAVNTPFVAGAGIASGNTGYSVASGGGRRFLPFVIYNPCTWERSEPVTVTLYDTDLNPSLLVARDEDGVSHPTLFLGKGADWGHENLTVQFMAQDIPALGYRTYLICEGIPDAEASQVAVLPGSGFETPYLKLQYDRFQCGFTEVIDKRNGTHYSAAKAGLGAWEYVVERPRGMTAWALGQELDAPLVLRSTSFQILGAHRNGGSGVVDGESIAYRIQQTLEVPGTQSTVAVTTLIHALEPRVDVTATIDWREIGDANRGVPGLVVRFPLQSLGKNGLKALYETPFGNVERTLADGEEVPSLRYAHVEGESGPDGGSGFTLLQDCKYGHSLSGSDLRLRMIRSSFDPDPTPEVNQHTIRYSLYFHDGATDPAALTRLGAAWNHPLLVIPANLQDGDAPSRKSFARVMTTNVVLSALKEAEDGSGLVLRLAELNGQETEAVVELDPALCRGLNQAARLDLMERVIEGDASLVGGTLRVPIAAHGLVTVRLSIGK